MEVATIELYQALDAADSYAIKLREDASNGWRSQRGFGASYQKAWSVEIQSERNPADFRLVDWDAVLDRIIEAQSLSDPLLTNFQWPVLQAS